MKLDPWWVTNYSGKAMSPEETNNAYRDLDAKVYCGLFPSATQGETETISVAVRSRWPELETEIPLELYPDAKPALEFLSSVGCLMALVSNAPPDTDKVVESLGLGKYLRSIIISGVVGYMKPHPEIFRIALGEQSVAPGEAIHIGDLYEADVVGARNAGIKGVLLDRDNSQMNLDCPRIRNLAEIQSQLTGS
jgi:HAD superfamily hydrolase (TIGR01549 family)